ncbi:abc transporter, ATP binding subunit [Heliomicrobium modesticaldum Ice1]|uniref:Abc transporter, ATP binding subunit n=1 Tax=Heliobacterium modesticaldum (strain ATCC 51547 / Ice1) TaxID=498761 RepID=B0THJ2_HELMI|nr:ABC transporter ATP-binding protein [Heliomicrobium modesticaldum]ABZ83430.1 abc transporter, ATP binding subunit [Heliomicrobium modesticaldum Ice1]
MALLEIQDVSKKFVLQNYSGQRLSNLFTSLLEARKYSNKRDFWALKNIDITLEQGKSLAIIGKNGCGKSTLLKLINGTLRPTTGSVRVNGTKSALIELGAGFHGDFTGRDNVFLSGMIMGMSKSEIKKRFDEIVDFAEIEEFIDVPVKYYSSGMHARLGFSVAIAVKPQLLIVDEVLAVGDANFKMKCEKRITEMKKQGVSLLFVTHDLSKIRTICEEGLWLNKGIVMSQGDIDTVVEQYANFINLGVA